MINLLKLIGVIIHNIQIKKECKRYKVKSKDIKVMKDFILAKKKGNRNKIAKLKLKRNIIIASILLSALFTSAIMLVYFLIKSNNTRATIEIARFITTKELEVGEYLLFSGSQSCDLDGNGSIYINAERLKSYGTKCNGKFALRIEYTSYETISLITDEMRKTIITLGVGSEENRLNKAELDTNGAEKDEGTNITNNKALSTIELDITREKKDIEIVLESGFDEILDKGAVIYGKNWIITKVVLVDIEKRESWKFDKSAETVEINLNPTNLELNNLSAPDSQADKNLYYMMIDMQQACDNISESLAHPAVVLGKYVREIGHKFYGEIYNDKFDYMQDLSSLFPEDGNELKKLGEIYQSSNNGYGQYNLSTWESQRRMFGNINADGGVTFDSELGFYRPNPWYGRDQIWTTVIYSYSGVLGGQEVKDIIETEKFNSLEDIDKKFIIGFIVEAYHNRGPSAYKGSVPLAYDLIEIANNKQTYGLSSLFDMSDVVGAVVYSSKNKSKAGSAASISNSSGHKQLYDSKFNLNWDTGGRFPYKEYAYIDSLCCGMKLYNDTINILYSSSGTLDNIVSAEGKGSALIKEIDTIHKTWKNEGFDYRQTLRNSQTYGKVRTDCSGYTTLALYRLGVVNTVTNYTSRSYLNNVMKFKVVGSMDEMQSGDIIAWDGHVQIFAGYGSNGERLWYNWGSNDAITMEWPNSYGDRWVYENYTTKKSIILRIP